MALLGGVVLVASGEAISSMGGRATNSPGSLNDQTGRPAAPAPTAVIPPGFVAPRLVAPASVLTNVPTITLTGTLAAQIVGQADYSVRIYRNGVAPTLVREVAVGAIPWFSIPDIALVQGPNAFTATLIGPAGETPASDPVTVVYSTAKPRVTVVSPTSGSRIAGRMATIEGTTSAGAAVVVRNSKHGSTVRAGTDGDAFSAVLPLDLGKNTLVITVTDQAGNFSTLKLTVSRVR